MGSSCYRAVVAAVVGAPLTAPPSWSLVRLARRSPERHRGAQPTGRRRTRLGRLRVGSPRRWQRFDNRRIRHPAFLLLSKQVSSIPLAAGVRLEHQPLIPTVPVGVLTVRPRAVGPPAPGRRLHDRASAPVAHIGRGVGCLAHAHARDGRGTPGPHTAPPRPPWGHGRGGPWIPGGDPECIASPMRPGAGRGEPCPGPFAAPAAAPAVDHANPYTGASAKRPRWVQGPGGGRGPQGVRLRRPAARGRSRTREGRRTRHA